PSASGKTTLLEALLGVARGGTTIAGARSFLGAPVPVPPGVEWRAWLRRSVAFVPQDARAALDPVQRLGVQAEELAGSGAVADRLAALGEPDPAGVLARFPHEVSGGQAQRVLLAVALARAPVLLVADEPTASLDPARQALLVEAIGGLR